MTEPDTRKGIDKIKDRPPAGRFNEKRHLDRVIPVRMSAEKWDEIKKEANELGVNSSALVRIWIMDGLRRLRKGLKPEID
jgi:hypothetical protein